MSILNCGWRSGRLAGGGRGGRFVAKVIRAPLLVVMSCAGLWQVTFAADAETEGGVAGLQEVVVTAQKRRENIQNVPIAMVALTAQTLSKNRVETTQDLQLLVPSLVYNNVDGFAEPFLRGVGSDVLAPNAEASVATYIDGAFVANTQSAIQQLLGVERIEVLNGPQGTLYGRNAVGGAINIITLTPTQQAEAEGTLTVGNFARKEGSFHVSGGLTDSLAVGLYLGGSIRNSYMDQLQFLPSTVLGPDQPAHETQWGARLKAVFQPARWLKLTGSYELTAWRSFEQSALREISPAALGYVLFPNLPQVIEPYVVTNAFPVRWGNRQEAATIREEVDLGWANILGISNYRNSKTETIADVGDTGAPVFSTSTPDNRSQQLSQELQLLSTPESKIKWVAGVYFFHELGGFFPNLATSTILSPPPIYNSNNFADVTTKSYAAFAQATIPLWRSLSLTLGGRFTTDKKVYSDYQTYTDINGATAAPSHVFVPASDPRRHQWNKFTPKVGLDYQLSNTLLYASYSEGFKSGVFNIATPTQVEPVNPEILKAYEIGIKTELWDRRIRWNSAAYYYDWTDLQVDINNSSTGGVVQLTNAGAAKAYGVESSIEAAVTGGLTLMAAVSAEHTRYTSFPSFPGVDPVTEAGITVDVTGNQVQRAPKLTSTVGAEYTKQLPAGRFEGSINWYYNSGFYWTPQNTRRQPSYNLLNASVGYVFPGERWKVSAWGRNLTNQYYAAGLLDVAVLGTLVKDAPPRMYGLSVDFSTH